MAATVIETTEMHTGGEPVRIVESGYPPIPGNTLHDKRRYARDKLDHLRRLLMFEPRGHADMYGVIPVEPDDPDADLAVLFMHNEGYSTMCGHATIALGRWAVDSGKVAPTEPETAVRIQVPAGLLTVRVEVENGRTGPARFEGVPSYVFTQDARIEVPGRGPVSLDIAYGGAFYAFVAAGQLGLDLRASPVRDLVDTANAITTAAARAVPLHHPDGDDMAFLYGTLITDGGDGRDRPSVNVCVFADRQVDRSPTGSGVQGRIAIEHARGRVHIGDERRFESITGAIFTGRAVREESAGGFPAVVVEVGGIAHYTGTSRFTLEDDDPLPGFLVR